MPSLTNLVEKGQSVKLRHCLMFEGMFQWIDLVWFQIQCRFIYCFMAIGILVCIVTIIGFIAAEAINGCCLCFVSFYI